MIDKLARKVRRVVKRTVKQMTAPALPADHQPVFVLGHQKSGTSAIAALLGEYSGLEATIDLHQEIRDLLIPRIEAGDASIEDLIKRNRDAFAAPIVKHPNLTLIYPHLVERFPSSRFVFVIRDPRDNIRSVLDRLGLAGDLTGIDDDTWEQIPKPWQLILGSDGNAPSGAAHLDALSDRWNLMADLYTRNASNIELIRYEDFVADKTGSIEKLAAELGLDGTNDIGSSVDRPFQPAGANRNVDVAEFFGLANLARIERRCASDMDQFGYSPRVAPDG